MDRLTFETSSSSSSCSWAVISDEPSGDEMENSKSMKVCSVCGLIITDMYFKKASCELCVLCDCCKELNLIGIPECIHNRNLVMQSNHEINSDSGPDKQPKEPIPSYQKLTETVRDAVWSVDEDSSPSPQPDEPSTKADINPDQTVLSAQEPSIRIGEGGRSLTEQIIEALQHSSPPIEIPQSLSTLASGMASSAHTISARGLRYSPAVVSYNEPRGSLSRSDSPSPISFTGNESPHSESSSSPSQNLNRISGGSQPDSPTLGPIGSLLTQSPSDRSRRNATVQFLKSVVLHSTAALNNFDLMPLDSPDPAITSAAPTQTKSSWLSSSVIQTKPPISLHTPNISSHLKVWDDDKFAALVKPRPIPKAVSENAAYNLR